MLGIRGGVQLTTVMHHVNGKQRNFTPHEKLDKVPWQEEPRKLRKHGVKIQSAFENPMQHVCPTTVSFSASIEVLASAGAALVIRRSAGCRAPLFTRA